MTQDPKASTLSKPTKKCPRNQCRYLIAQRYHLLPIECLALPKRLARSLARAGRLGNLHGLARREVLGYQGLGRRSLDQLEEFLVYCLRDGFEIVSHGDFQQPTLPGIVGRPLVEVLEQK